MSPEQIELAKFCAALFVLCAVFLGFGCIGDHTPNTTARKDDDA